jgi:hypothetical protein
MPVSDMRVVHEWFLHRGLPLVLTRRVRSHALVERSAPMVSGIGAVISLTMVLAELTDGDPDYGYAIRLTVLTLLLVAAPFALYLLHRSRTSLGEAGRRTAALLVMALFVFGLPFADSGFTGIAAVEIIGFAFIAVLAIWLTYVGIGSIVLWAFRFALVQVGALGTLMRRALPLLMLTVVVFFTGELWQLAARVKREQLWYTIGFLAAVALIFVVTTIRDEVLALREDRDEQTDPAKLLEDTPLANAGVSAPTRTPLSLAEQVNVVAVMVVAQTIQVVLFTAGLFAFFVALGVVAIPDDVAVLWAAEDSCWVGDVRVPRAENDPPCPGTWFGIHTPVPQTVVQVSLFVAVLSGLYFTISTSVDPMYRERFFDPLISDVAVSLAGRDTYLELEGKR